MCAQPKYIEIFEWIKQQIDIGNLKPGERMYSEKELVELFSVSRQTVRHAISKLEYEDIVVKRRGSGTYIRKADSGAEPSGSMQIAVVTTYVDDYIFPRIIQEIQHTIAREGYMMQLMFTNNSVEKEREILNQLIEENNVAGMIIEPTKSALPNPNIPLFEKLAGRGVPVVFLNSYYPQLEVPREVLDD
ncbi:GntR family transcriptional regulator, partial [Muricomes intestini]|uniref:GntR family transcriptional regulator n=1 Tax=Muricomes intestini TaxID=1796634 RepID=UPI002FDD3212